MKSVTVILAASLVLVGAASVFAAGTLHFVVMSPADPKQEAASAGEVFAQSLLGPGEKPESVFTPVPVDSHKAALEAVLSDGADYAVVKSTVFVPAQYQGLIEVGSAAGEHPDNTLIMPTMAFERFGALISRVLLGLKDDTSEKAAAVKQAFGCTGFIATVGSDFAPTFTLLRKARVDPKTFAFVF